MLAETPAAPTSGQISGQISVIDGDTIRLTGPEGRLVVRLEGIDAPEKAQTCRDAGGRDWPCGRWARREAALLFSGRTGVCDVLGQDRYGRVLGRCAVDGQDMGRVLVRRGMAWAFRRYSLDYVDDEKVALFAEAGVWRGPAQPAWEYRAALRTAPPEPQAAPDATCAIKGNISGNGRIYHLPGQENYDDTRISPVRGERWFCSEAEALAAGWRRARR